MPYGLSEFLGGLFWAYSINALYESHHISQNSKIKVSNLNADGTVVYQHGVSESDDQEKLQSSVLTLNEWYWNNKLATDPAKHKVTDCKL